MWTGLILTLFCLFTVWVLSRLTHYYENQINIAMVSVLTCAW